jgi:hypothetical protein
VTMAGRPSAGRTDLIDGCPSEAEMEEIKRIGPPTPINRRGSAYDLSVPLNATPSRMWQRTFQAAG